MSNVTDNSMVEVVLGLGSNHGYREENLKMALGRLSSILECLQCSRFYETPAIGTKSSGTYLNAVAGGLTLLKEEELDRILKQIELESGRDAEARKRGEVPLDIDIVIYEGRIVRPRDYAQSFFRIGYDTLNFSK